MLIASCRASHCSQSLTRTVQETLQLVKKEVHRTTVLTTEKVKCNEVDFQIGNEIIYSLAETANQADR